MHSQSFYLISNTCNSVSSRLSELQHCNVNSKTMLKKNAVSECFFFLFRIKQVKERTFWMKPMASKDSWPIQEIW